MNDHRWGTDPWPCQCAAFEHGGYADGEPGQRLRCSKPTTNLPPLCDDCRTAVPTHDARRRDEPKAGQA